MIEGAAPTGATRAAQHCEELLSNSLETLDVDALSPREALDTLYALKSQASETDT